MTISAFAGQLGQFLAVVPPHLARAYRSASLDAATPFAIGALAGILLVALFGFLLKPGNARNGDPTTRTTRRQGRATPIAGSRTPAAAGFDRIPLMRRKLAQQPDVLEMIHQAIDLSGSDAVLWRPRIVRGLG